MLVGAPRELDGRRFRLAHAPKHGSWLKPAEIEVMSKHSNGTILITGSGSAAEVAHFAGGELAHQALLELLAVGFERSLGCRRAKAARGWITAAVGRVVRGLPAREGAPKVIGDRERREV